MQFPLAPEIGARLLAIAMTRIAGGPGSGPRPGSGRKAAPEYAIGMIAHDGSIESKDWEKYIPGLSSKSHVEIFSRRAPAAQKFRMKDNTLWWDDTPSEDDMFTVQDHFENLGVKIKDHRTAYGTVLKAAGGPGSGPRKGDGAHSESVQHLLKNLSITDNPDNTAFVLRDGTRLAMKYDLDGPEKRWGQTHSKMAGNEERLARLLEEGVIRYTTDGVEIRAVPTPEQAQLLADDYNHFHKVPLFVDMTKFSDNNAPTEKFERPINPERIRNWAKRVLALEGEDDETIRTMSLLPEDSQVWPTRAGKLAKSFTFSDRRSSASFLSALFQDANISNHHPDVVLDGDNVTVTWCTHMAGDEITQLDYEAAERADRIYGTYRGLGGPGSGPRPGDGSHRNRNIQSDLDKQEAKNQEKQRKADIIGYDAHTAAKIEMSKRMNFNPDLIDVVVKEPPSFTVGDKTFREGGHFDPTTGRIEINGRNASKNQEENNGLVAHEIFHAQWQEALQMQMAEHETIGNWRSEDIKKYWAVDGSPRPEHIAELRERFPASALFADTLGDAYLGPNKILLDDGDKPDPDSSLQQMIREDGASDYSKAYWESDRDLLTKANETLAEVTRLQMVPRSWHPGDKVAAENSANKGVVNQEELTQALKKEGISLDTHKEGEGVNVKLRKWGSEYGVAENYIESTTLSPALQAQIDALRKGGGRMKDPYEQRISPKWEYLAKGVRDLYATRAR